MTCLKILKVLSIFTATLKLCWIITTYQKVEYPHRTTIHSTTITQNWRETNHLYTAT